jgi:Flp pilus assembly protein TadD
MADRNSSIRRARRAAPESKPSNVNSAGIDLRGFLGRIGTARTVLVICLLSSLAYANSLGGGFVFDDTEQIVENQDVRSWNNLAKAFTTHVWQFRDRPGALDLPPPLPYYRPLFTAMLTVEFHLFGLWPQGWHLVSLLLHVLCAIGVFYVALLMSGRSAVAVMASALFAVHPVHAESVSWISGMTDPLFGVFFLASFYFHLKARATSNRRALGLSLVLFVLAAFAKETALSLVLLVFAYEMVSTESNRPRLARALKRARPFAAAALIYLIPRYLVLGELMWKNPQAPDRPLALTILTLPFVIWSYISHLIWPIGLSVTYATRFVTSAASPNFLLPAGALLLLGGALILYRKKVSPEAWKGLLLIAVPLVPVLNLGQVSREEYLVFDHYLYLSVAGLAYLAAVGVNKLATIKSTRTSRLAWVRPNVVIVMFALLVLACTAAAAGENRAWADSYSLWSKVARVRPNYWGGHYNTGLALLDARRFEDARWSLLRARELKPDEASIWNALGRAYDGLGEVSAAVASFKLSLQLDPEMFQSHNDLGAVYFKIGDYRLAESSFVAALELRPQAYATHYNLGLCYSKQARYEDAARELERAVAGMPDDAEALYELGVAYERLGRYGDAGRVFRTGRNLAKSSDLAGRLSEGLSRLPGQSDNSRGPKSSDDNR